MSNIRRYVLIILCISASCALNSCEDDFAATPGEKQIETEPPIPGKLYFMEFDFLNLTNTSTVKAWPDGTKNVLAPSTWMFNTPQKNALVTLNMISGQLVLLDSNGAYSSDNLFRSIPSDALVVASSPDGLTYAYAEQDLDTEMGILYTVSLARPIPTIVSTTFDIGTTPVFSPDGSWLAYYTKVIDKGLGSETDGFEVSSAPFTLGGATKSSIDAADIFENTDDELDQISWHPQSNKVLFHTMTGVYHFDFIAGMTSKIGDGIHGVFSPDGSQIIYADMTLGKYDLYRTDLTGSFREQVTFSSTIVEVFPQWSPDGKWISFTELPYDPRVNDEAPDKIALKAVNVQDPQREILFSTKALRGFWLPD